MALLFLWMLGKKEPLLLISAVMLFSGAVYLVQEFRSLDDYDYPQGFEGQVKFDSSFTVDGDSLRGFAELDSGTKVYAKYKFKSAEEKSAIEQIVHKARFHVSGEFEEASPPSHRFSFDMISYLKKNGASYILSIGSINGIEEDIGFSANLLDRREWLKHHIRSSFPESLSTEAEALLIGEREKMSIEDQQIYQTLGISHLFAISGLHVGIAVALLYFVLVRCHMRKETALLAMLIIMPLYAVLAGGAPSVWRAVSMVSAVLLCRLVRIRLPIAHILMISFVFFVLAYPYIIYKIGFQLSYGASFGIIYSLRLLEKSGSPIKTGLMITFISQFTLYPLLLFHFYELSLSAFFVNSIFVPLYTMVILPVNFLLLFLTLLFPPAADFLFYFYEPMRNFIGEWMESLAMLPFQMWNPGKPGAAAMVVLLISVVLFYSSIEKGFKWRKTLIPLIPALCISFAPYADGSLKITFLDVGQGDSAVIELPYRRAVYLIDSGGLLRFDAEEFKSRERPYEIGRQVVAPYLKGKGISALDAMILSHPDADHAEGAEEIFKLFRVRELHLTPGSLSAELMQELAPFAGESVLRLPGKGSSWQKGDAQFSYLAPDDHEYEGNNDSLVLLMQRRDFKVLFTGDLEIAGERELVDHYPDKLNRVSVLKVGHHGSKTSSGEEFLSAISPAVSIFSTGRDNRYGHPSPEVVDRFRELNLKTLNTAENGTIEFIYKNGEVSLKAMR